ncbi:MAG: GtrA family protein [Candidatus Fimenecus sp.]
MIDLIKKYKEIILYVIFGAATTAINWIVYTVCIKVFSLEMTLSNALAWIIAVLFAFVTNKVFVFESKDKSIVTILKEGVSFFGSRVATGVLEIFLPTLLFKIGLDQSFLGIDGFWAKAFVSVLVIILNYVFSKLIVFRKKK